MTLKYWGCDMDNLEGKEFNDLSPYEKEVVLLSIKYQMDLMSMKFDQVKSFLSPRDWKKLQTVMKHGRRIH